QAVKPLSLRNLSSNNRDRYREATHRPARIVRVAWLTRFNTRETAMRKSSETGHRVSEPGIAACPDGSAECGKETKAMLDFRTKGPRLWQCELCIRQFRGWEVRDEDWRLIPPEYWPMVLCEEDYLRLVRQAGHDASKVEITHETWRRQAKRWEKDNQAPPN